MSRIGKQPVQVPKGVEVAASEVRVAPRGETITRETRAYHGMTRALLSNMVKGVTQGYQKQLEVVGVGWNAQARGKELVLSVGFCKPITVHLPDGVNAAAPSPTALNIWGADKQLVGQIAAQIRSIRPPEPYKGKGVRYKGEYVRQKAGKSFGS